ncbi:hypothetical protein [Microvirga antarctica]|uniref:hypothetical protein n=1 Tax=Microvirga antarctica TaxID=2819233 RepID=UPI001B30326F|nr:hypothetical protein [Microvirga antarctica]
MTSFRLAGAVVTMVLSVGAAIAGPCTVDIDKMQARLDERVDSVAGKGATGKQAETAQLHHQPTPQSIAKAEEKLGEGIPLEPAAAALVQARQADAAGDKAACEASLAEVRRIIGP